MIARQTAVWVVALAALAAGMGVLWGRASFPPTESEVIDAMVARYVAQTGGAETDCVARPSPEDGVWIVVDCVRDQLRHSYPVDRKGRLVVGASQGI